jgi:hypothetical protein
MDPSMPKSTRRTPCTYAQFVKANYAAARAKFTRPQERIQHIATLWRQHKSKGTQKIKLVVF